MEDTINALDAAGIPYFGVNNRVYEKTINNEKLLFVGFVVIAQTVLATLKNKKTAESTLSRTKM